MDRPKAGSQQENFMNILSKNTISSKATAGTIVGKFSHPGATAGTWNLDAEAQVFFSTDSSGNLLWTAKAGATVLQGFYAINVSAVFGGYDAEDSQFTIQVTA
jgi:hypothetical protein